MVVAKQGSRVRGGIGRVYGLCCHVLPRGQRIEWRRVWLLCVWANAGNNGVMSMRKERMGESKLPACLGLVAKICE